MNPALRHQLAHLDRALLALLDERARLLAAVPADDPGRAAAVEDLLRRHAGGFDPARLAELFAVVDRGCVRRAEVRP
jgi:chorismate mutase